MINGKLHKRDRNESEMASYFSVQFHLFVTEKWIIAFWLYRIFSFVCFFVFCRKLIRIFHSIRRIHLLARARAPRFVVRVNGEGRKSVFTSEASAFIITWAIHLNCEDNGGGGGKRDQTDSKTQPSECRNCWNRNKIFKVYFPLSHSQLLTSVCVCVWRSNPRMDVTKRDYTFNANYTVFVQMRETVTTRISSTKVKALSHFRGHCHLLVFSISCCIIPTIANTDSVFCVNSVAAGTPNSTRTKRKRKKKKNENSRFPNNPL